MKCPNCEFVIAPDYRDNAAPTPVPPPRKHWKDRLDESIERAFGPGLIIGLLSAIGLVLCGLANSCNTNEEYGLAAGRQSLIRWQETIEKRQAVLDEAEKQQAARELARKMATEELERRAITGKSQ